MSRRVSNTRIAAFASTLAAGVLAAFALRSSPATTGTATHVNQQAAEVRTQVIRRTVHIVRHERPPRGPATHGRPSTAGAVSGGGTSVSGLPPRTAASGSRSGVSSGPATTSAPRTRTSGVGVRPAPSTGAAPAPARTRTSGARGGAPSSGAPRKGGAGAPVRTRTSGTSAGGGTGGAGSGGAVRTRTSGGGEDSGGKGHDD